MLNQPRRTIRALIEQRIGLAQTLQERVNLDGVLDDLSGGNLEVFARTLQMSATSDPPWQQLIKALVIGETYFLRNRAHFDLLRSTILPDIRARQPYSLNLWSAGCATGEEPYSLAITLREALPDFSRWTIHLLGTDLNHYALQAAERGVYRNWSFRHTEKDFQARYFSPVDNSWQLVPLIRDMVTFRQHNVLDLPPVARLDVIFCCNVLLYFEKSQVYTVEDRLFDILNPGGWLILGQAEALQFKRERWTTHIFPGAVVYQKPVGEMQLAYYHAITPQVHRPTSTGHNQTPPFIPPSPALVQTTYAEAVQLMRLKNYAAAEQMLNAILSQMPDNGAAHVLMGCLLANRGSLPQAHEQLDRALQLDGLQADAHYLKGVLFLESAQTDAALDSLRAALYCRRGHPLAATILGHLYMQSGDDLRAERVWKEALDGLRDLAPQTPVSDLSDLTAEGVSEFLSEQLKLLED
jgi:chemotaxis protein methyltransferase CheR